jgi:hypothetical protein
LSCVAPNSREDCVKMTGKISSRAIGRRSDDNDAPKAASVRGIPD